MRSIIDELWNENICPKQNDFMGSPEYKAALKEVFRLEGELEKTMTNEQKELLEKLCDSKNKFEELLRTAAFSTGFRLGARFMLDINSRDTGFSED